MFLLVISVFGQPLIQGEAVFEGSGSLQAIVQGTLNVCYVVLSVVVVFSLMF